MYRVSHLSECEYGSLKCLWLRTVLYRYHMYRVSHLCECEYGSSKYLWLRTVLHRCRICMLSDLCVSIYICERRAVLRAKFDTQVSHLCGFSPV